MLRPVAAPGGATDRPGTSDPDAVLATLRDERLLAILRYRSGGPVGAALAALRRAGVRLAEVTVDTPGAYDAVQEAAAAGHLVGMGTVTAVSQVRDAAAAGALFVVSPGVDADVVRAARDAGLEALPGVATATEVLTARRAGARVLKLFPASVLGVEHLTALRGPFPDVELVPTGGVRPADVARWLTAGAVAVAVGSELAGREAPSSPEEEEALGRRARALLAAVREAR